MARVTIATETPTLAELDDVVAALASWQREGAPVQLHPGDLGWNWSLGGERTAAAVRLWRREGVVVAAGLLDGPTLVRMAVSPEVDADEDVAARLVADLTDPSAGVLPEGTASVEMRAGSAVRRRLTVEGWTPDEPWTPLRRSLSEPVPEAALQVEVVDGDSALERVDVHRGAFANSTFSVERWEAMAATPAYRAARCLLGRDADGTPVAAATVWSAGRGRPGLLEPVGVHRDHQGHGHGTAISLAAAAALREMGASSATVCTPSSNVAAVATYAAAGYTRLPDVTDFRRPE